uniref:Uncharacterized protein n=1 Tax=Ackermannviridae sp. ctaCq7 TaxID=2827294 RepID=A0A8S5R6B1_9CAUD|nr:MAG TPA: hypothetical protein [Ackermannviridae sp. ctaCq7]
MSSDFIQFYQKVLYFCYFILILLINFFFIKILLLIF